ncbi:MAG: phosphopantetheine-binding protein [Ruminococcus sp.]|nr:phosphopantetheine-binding protein [Ruminococcus sp.]MCD7800535.1 phosphopantetheine-binding protein [Ruminococcus sp.]
MLESLKELITNYVEVDINDIKEDSRFIEDLGFNSYVFMSFLGEVEDIYDVEVDEQEVLKLITVADAIAYIQRLQSEE